MMFRKPNYDHILMELINNEITWKKGSSNEVISFLRTNLTHNLKTWFYFVSTKLRLSKHISTVLRDKAIITYEILSGCKFNVGHVIESSIIEFENGKALLHLSLITRLCLMAEVEMSEFEKCSLMATLPLLKEKQGSHPSKPTVGQSTNDYRDEGKEEADPEELESEED